MADSDGSGVAIECAEGKSRAANQDRKTTRRSGTHPDRADQDHRRAPQDAKRKEMIDVLVSKLLKLCGYPPDHGALAAGRPRSPGWEALSKEYRKAFKECECCGAAATVTHHCVPFHVAPDQELAWSNLISLCDSCHFLMHGRDWRCWLPDCRRLAQTIRAAIKARSE